MKYKEVSADIDDDYEYDSWFVLADSNGEEIEVRHLDKVKWNGKKFVVLQEGDYDIDDDGNDVEPEIMVLEIVKEADGTESYISPDGESSEIVFNIFKNRFLGEFDFLDI